jgi:hypothetical protein
MTNRLNRKTQDRRFPAGVLGSGAAEIANSQPRLGIANWRLRAPGICVREWSNKIASANVRFWGQSGHGADVLQCLLLTQSGHCQRQPDHFQPPSLTRYDAPP